MNRNARGVWAAAIAASLVSQPISPLFARSSDPNSNDNNTATPIRHVIVLIGENRTFDHVFATYVPPSGDSIANLLSEGIVHADGTPGENFGAAAQFKAKAPFSTKYFSSLPSSAKT